MYCCTCKARAVSGRSEAGARNATAGFFGRPRPVWWWAVVTALPCLARLHAVGVHPRVTVWEKRHEVHLCLVILFWRSSGETHGQGYHIPGTVIKKPHILVRQFVVYQNQHNTGIGLSVRRCVAAGVRSQANDHGFRTVQRCCVPGVTPLALSPWSALLGRPDP